MLTLLDVILSVSEEYFKEEAVSCPEKSYAVSKTTRLTSHFAFFRAISRIL